MLLYFPALAEQFLKAYIHGHYRLNPKTGQRIWIESHQDKRPERHRASFDNTAHRVTHFQHHLGRGQTREAMQAFHDLGHDDAHQLARHLGLAGDEKGQDKKALMESIYSRVQERKQAAMHDPNAKIEKKAKRVGAKKATAETKSKEPTAPAAEKPAASTGIGRIQDAPEWLQNAHSTVFIEGRDADLADQYGISLNGARLSRGNVRISFPEALDLIKQYDDAFAGGVVYENNKKRMKAMRGQFMTAFGPDMEEFLRQRDATGKVGPKPGAPAPAEKPAATAPAKPKLEPWHTPIPDQGMGVQPGDERAGTGNVPHRAATEAYEAIPRTALEQGLSLYLHVLPSTETHHGAARLLPEDQKAPAGWKMESGKAYRPGFKSKDQAIREIQQDLMRSPILATGESMGRAPKKVEAAKPAASSRPGRKKDMETLIKISADSVKQLRRVDVERVLDHGLDVGGHAKMNALADYIIAHRPELAEAVQAFKNDL